jgi:hypothetical protein
VGYGPLYNMISESYPTSLRSSGSALTYLFQRIAGILAPILTGLLIEYKGGQSLAVILYGILYGSMGFLVCLLAETRTLGRVDRLISVGR